MAWQRTVCDSCGNLRNCEVFCGTDIDGEPLDVATCFICTVEAERAYYKELQREAEGDDEIDE